MTAHAILAGAQQAYAMLLHYRSMHGQESIHMRKKLLGNLLELKKLIKQCQAQVKPR